MPAIIRTKKAVDLGGIAEPVGIHVTDFVSIGSQMMREIPTERKANLRVLAGRQTHRGCQGASSPCQSRFARFVDKVGPHFAQQFPFADDRTTGTSVGEYVSSRHSTSTCTGPLPQSRPYYRTCCLAARERFCSQPEHRSIICATAFGQ